VRSDRLVPRFDYSGKKLYESGIAWRRLPDHHGVTFFLVSGTTERVLWVYLSDGVRAGCVVVKAHVVFWR
jgi:hypothetical protein